MSLRSDDMKRDDVVKMLDVFYASVRLDDELGPLFASEISDWPAYTNLMTGFWCEALLKGPKHPIPSPPGLLYGMTRGSLARWHLLFVKATSATLSPEQAIRMRLLSQQISDLQSGL